MHINFLFLISLISFPVALSATSSKPNRTFETAEISVYSKTNDLKIFLNGKYIGQTPIENHVIPKGKYVVTAIAKKAPIWGEHLWKQTFSIDSNEKRIFEVVIPRQFYLNSTPYGAKVIYQDSILGKTPIYFTLPDTSQGLLILRKSGFLDHIIKLAKNRVNVFNIKLNLNQQFEKEKIRLTSNLKSKQYRRKILTYSMLGLSVISGLSTIYFRREADEKYNHYLTSGNPVQMERLYQDTQQLDNYAAISYGVFQVSFVTSLYFLFFNK